MLVWVKVRLGLRLRVRVRVGVSACERILVPSLGWLAMMRTSRSLESCITSRNWMARAELLLRSLTW